MQESSGVLVLVGANLFINVVISFCVQAMIDRGWSTKVMNSDGLDVRKLIEVGVEHQKKSANKLKKSKGWLMKVAMKHVKAHAALVEMLRYAEEKGL